MDSLSLCWAIISQRSTFIVIHHCYYRFHLNIIISIVSVILLFGSKTKKTAFHTSQVRLPCKILKPSAMAVPHQITFSVAGEVELFTFPRFKDFTMLEKSLVGIQREMLSFSYKDIKRKLKTLLCIWTWERERVLNKKVYKLLISSLYQQCFAHYFTNWADHTQPIKVILMRKLETVSTKWQKGVKTVIELVVITEKKGESLFSESLRVSLYLLTAFVSFSLLIENTTAEPLWRCFFLIMIYIQASDWNQCTCQDTNLNRTTKPCSRRNKYI